MNAEIWRECVNAFDAEQVRLLAEWRGYSIDFCQWLKERGLVGLYEKNLAFPIKDEHGAVFGVHARLKDGSWRVVGGAIRPLVIDDPKNAAQGMVFESQWDAFAVMDKLGWHRPENEFTDAIIVTRGASNGKLVSRLCVADSVLYAFKQNDETKEGRNAADQWLEAVRLHAGCKVYEVQTPALYKDANEWTKEGNATEEDISAAIKAAKLVTGNVGEDARPTGRVTWLAFYSPSECRDYAPPDGLVLVGDCHITRGNVTVIGGPPGVGKSRAALALAVAGATGQDWFALTVHGRFKTLILQNENGRYRLQNEFSEIHCAGLDDYIRVSGPPPYGMAFSEDEFRRELTEYVGRFEPEVVIVDPWNAVAPDDKQRDYMETFNAIRGVLPKGEAAPAIVIVAHTRKPKHDERTSGRGLMHLLAGSYTLGSVPRCVFVMLPGSDDTTDDRVVWECCKNNDGEMGKRSCWHRRNGLFVRCKDFDWETFDNPPKDNGGITREDLDRLFDSGKRQMVRKHAVTELMAQTGQKQASCYNALKVPGRFDQWLSEGIDGLLTWTP